MQKVAKQILCCPRQDLWALDRHQAFLHLCQVSEVAGRVVLGRVLTEVRRNGTTVSTRRTGHDTSKLEWSEPIPRFNPRPRPGAATRDDEERIQWSMKQ